MNKRTEIPNIKLYSDGGAEPNPGKGGFGVILSYKGIKKEFFRGYKLTTNNRMELMGVIFGLERLKKKSNVDVYTDSNYVVEGINKGWAKKWKENNWIRSKNQKAINSDLWDRLLNAISKHNVKFHWVKGHAGHPENERCDTLANYGIHSSNQLEDEGYIANENKISDTKTNIASTIKKKIEKEGDKCRKCDEPVIKKMTRKKYRKIKPGQKYYYEYYLLCPGCNTMYFTEDGKRAIPNEKKLFD